MSSFDIPPQLFTMLANAESQPPKWVRAAGAADAAAGNINKDVLAYQGQQRQKKLDSFFDTPVPSDTLKRVIPGAPTDGSITYRDLGALSSAGLTNELKDPNTSADIRSLAMLGSGGDPDKFTKLMNVFSQSGTPGQPAPTTLTLNPATIAAVRAIRPPKPAAAAKTTTPSQSPVVKTLTSLQSLYQKQLSGDLSESDRATAQSNLDAVNRRLARIGGVSLPTPPAAPAAAPSSAPAPAAATPNAKAPAPAATTSAVIQKLLAALSQ